MKDFKHDHKIRPPAFWGGSQGLEFSHALLGGVVPDPMRNVRQTGWGEIVALLRDSCFIDSGLIVERDSSFIDSGFIEVH